MFLLKKRRWGPLLLNVLLVTFSVAQASRDSGRVRLLASLLGIVSAACIALNTGWVPPSTIAGTYLGIVFDSGVKGGTKLSQMQETAWAVGLGAATGLAVGLFLDRYSGRRGGPMEERKRFENGTERLSCDKKQGRD
jgi:hypothetical protein